MTVREQATWWGLCLAALILLLVLLSNVLLPFLLGAAIAYFSDPVADRLEKLGFSRAVATAVITVCALIVLIVTFVVLTPLLINQIRLAVDAAPGIIGSVREFLESEAIPFVTQGDTIDGTLKDAFNRFQEQVQKVSVTILQSALSIGLAGVQFITLAVVTPVVAFYLLLDWDRMIAEIDSLLPLQHKDTIHMLARQVDGVLAGFVRGQLTVCLILGTFYAVSLTLIQLPFGLLVGIFAGLISFIPFVGAILGGAVSLGIALVHFWNDPIWIFATAAVFGIGQAVEGNYLTPRLVGGSVGLHPVWLMFALSAFGVLFGFTGLLIAVPAAAVIGVFLRFSAERYRESQLYLGMEEDEPAESATERGPGGAE